MNRISRKSPTRQPVRRLAAESAEAVAAAPSARGWVIPVVIVCVIMAVLPPVIPLLHQAEHQGVSLRERAKHLAQDSARNLDYEIASAEALIQGLSVSQALDRGDLADFYTQARTIAKPPGSWIVLADPRGRQLISTLLPFGTPLSMPSVAQVRDVASVVASRTTRVTDLVRAENDGAEGIAVAIPVIRDGKVNFVLEITLLGEHIMAILGHSQLPAGWTAIALDRLGQKLATFPAGGGEFGQLDWGKLDPQLRLAGEEGFEEDIQGRGRFFIAHSRSAAAGVTILVAMPREVSAAATQQLLPLIAGGGVVLLLVAVCLGFMAASRIDRRYQQRIADSEIRFRTMAETVPGILFIAGPDGSCEYINRRFYDYTGRSAGGGLGFGWIDTVHPDDREQVLRSLTEPAGESGVLLHEGRLLAHDGTYRWFLGRSLAVRDEAGRVSKWFGSVTDVDDFKRANASLSRTNDRLSAVLSSISESYCTVDHLLKINYANSAAARFFGQEADQLIGCYLPSLAPQFFGPDLAMRLCAASDQRIAIRTEVQSSQESGFWLELNAYPWADGVGIFFRDISRRKQIEHSLQAAREELQGIIDAWSACVAVVDWNGIIVAGNAAWRRLCGESDANAAGAVGASYFTVCAGQSLQFSDFKQVAAGIWSVIRGEAEEFRSDHMCKSPQGSLWFQIRASRFEECGETRVAITHEDITEIKRAEADLQALAGRLLQIQDEERRRLARELHDTTAQNLVAALLELDRLPEGWADVDPEAKARIDNVYSQLRRSLEEIRTLSYLLHPPLLEELGLASALRWYVRGFSERSRISVTLHVQSGLERLPETVERTLFRVVQEALTNIHRHSGSATAHVRLGWANDEIELEVADEGHGIARADFNAVEDVYTLGVGISGMRARLQQLGGRLELHSTARGVTVTARLPREAAKAHPLDDKSLRSRDPAA
jgi:PAS domain S-box-containing protein